MKPGPSSQRNETINSKNNSKHFCSIPDMLGHTKGLVLCKPTPGLCLTKGRGTRPAQASKDLFTNCSWSLCVPNKAAVLVTILNEGKPSRLIYLGSLKTTARAERRPAGSSLLVRRQKGQAATPGRGEEGPRSFVRGRGDVIPKQRTKVKLKHLSQLYIISQVGSLRR